MLHDKCLSRKPPPKHDAAFLGQAKGKPKSKGNGNAKVKNASSNEASKKGNKSSSSNKQEECSFCGRSNHTEERCFAKKSASKAAKDKVKSKPNTSSNSTKEKKEDSQAKVAYVARSSHSPPSLSSSSACSFVAISQPSSQALEEHSKGEWIADSGASTNMTHSSSHFENYKSISSQVRIGDDSSLSVDGIGDISFGNASLHDVLHAAELAQTLLLPRNVQERSELLEAYRIGNGTSKVHAIRREAGFQFICTNSK